MNSSESSSIALPYDSAEQQRLAATLGMWIFLATEILFFGILFVAYTVYRFEYPEAFRAGSNHLNRITGAVMTAILLTGSLCVALADVDVRSGNACRKMVVRKLTLTAVLGIAFLALEFHEYGKLFQEGFFPGPGFARSQFAELTFSPSAKMFFCLFFFTTGLHALHMIIGVTLIAGLALIIHRATDVSRYRTLLENIGLYWHFVDIVWIFLFPLYYLIETS